MARYSPDEILEAIWGIVYLLIAVLVLGFIRVLEWIAARLEDQG